jgi:hypothetical protein
MAYIWFRPRQHARYVDRLCHFPVYTGGKQDSTTFTEGELRPIGKL